MPLTRSCPSNKSKREIPNSLTQWTPQQRVKDLKIGYIPEDRQKMGLVMSFTIARNLILKVFRRLPFCRGWFLQPEAIISHADHAIQQFDIRAISGLLKVRQLSGGNQQKVVLARELSGQPDLIIAMQPTRGLDVGATEYVQKALLAERERGAAILYISTELEEVMRMSDRIAVMYAGRFVAILDAKATTVEQIGLSCFTSKLHILTSRPLAATGSAWNLNVRQLTDGRRNTLTFMS